MKWIEVTNLKKHYQLGATVENTVKALDGVTLSIDKGEFVAIVGSSGSGKSTLLQILGLLDHPSEGSYFFCGEDVTRLDSNQLAQIRSHHIGFVFQLFNLLPRTNVLNNVALPMIYRGMGVDFDRCKQTLKRLGMEQHHFHTPAQLSGGQQQRVAIARSLINHPELILADEPTGNLPRQQADEIIGELESLNRQGITVLIITHDEVVAKRAKRIIRLVDGRVESDQATSNRTNAADAISKHDPTLPTRNVNVQLWWETIKIAAANLFQNKFRTCLTMLGIVIGVFAVVCMLAIGAGAKRYVAYSLRKMGSNMFHVQSERPYSTNATKSKINYSRLTMEDLAAIEQLKVTGHLIRSISPSIYSRVSAAYKGKSIDTQIEGVSTAYEKMRGNTPASGRFFTEEENRNLEKVCLIGYTVYQELFDSKENPLGTLISIGNKTFRVIGLLPSKGATWEQDADDLILVPYLTAMKRLVGNKYISKLFIEARNEDAIDQAMNEVTETLRRTHRISKDQPNDFNIKNYSEIKETIRSATDTMAMFIGVVALISLVVGGIGIMNIMLVSVTERTREIGIRKAVGARNRDILTQFLIESSLIGMSGGVLGILLAFVFGALVESWIGWQVEFRPLPLMFSFVFSLLVGVFFGLYPANKAARLSPISALRYE